MTKYEILYIIRPNIDEEAKKTLVERFDGILADNGATIVESKDWEKRRLAYEIQEFREGIYHIVNLETEVSSAAISEFDRLAKINADILRHMVSRVEEFSDGKSNIPARKPRGRREALESVESEATVEAPASEVVETVEEA